MKEVRLKYGHLPNRFFVGDIVEDELDRQFIVDNVQKLNPYHPILRTKLIYSYSLLNGFSIHKCIDNVPNYVIILTIKECDATGKPYMLAMYSEWALNR
jgi:hypothetical protein